jgi:iron complex outermembrane recepter protein
MKLTGVVAALLIASASAADMPELLPPWIVTDTPLRPDATPVRANALVPGEAWSGRAMGTLADAFRLLPGAILQESFGGFEPPRLSIRGSGVQSAPSSRGLALLFNQLPLGLADGSFNSALFDPQLATRVDVQRGLDGWRAAPATLGGALDLRAESAGGASSALRFEAGSFGALRLRVSDTISRDSTSARVALGHAQQDGFREHSGQERTTVSAIVDHTARSGVRTSAELYRVHARYAVPGPLTLRDAEAYPAGISSDVRRDQPARVAELTRLAATAAQFTSAYEWDAGIAFGRTDDEFRQLQAAGVSRSRSDDVSARVSAVSRFTLLGLVQQCRVSATATRGWRDLRRFRNDAANIGTLFGDDGLAATTATVQIENAIAIGRRVVATAGVARVSGRRDIDDRRGPTRARSASTATLPETSVRWRVTPAATLFATFSESAEAPTFDDLIVVSGTYPAVTTQMISLHQQRAVTTEIGLRASVGPLACDAAVYRAAWQNEILRLTDARGVALGAINAGDTTHEGIEVSARWHVLQGPLRVTLSTSMVWTHFDFDDDPVYGRNRLAGMPPNLGTAEVLVNFPHGYFAGAGVDWTAGRTAVDHAGRLGYGGHALFHLRAGRTWGQWTFFADARNLLDRASIASTAGVLDRARNPAATAIFLPAAGRTLTLGLEWRR